MEQVEEKGLIMTTNQEAVLEYLQENGTPDDLVEIVRVETAPLYGIANVGKYPLLTAEERDLDRIKEAYLPIIECEISRVECFSLLSLSSKPGWMTDEVFGKSLISSFGSCIGGVIQKGLWCGIGSSLNVNDIDCYGGTHSNTLWNNLGGGRGPRHLVDLQKTIREHLWVGLGKVLRHALECPVEEVFRASFYGDGVYGGIWHDLQLQLSESLIYYHAAALNGDRENLALLSPLIREYCISLPPFGLKNDEPTVIVMPST
jgi:hypothetical protein